MGNCLVTKLKGVVDNDSLLKLGELRFGLKNNQNARCNFNVPQADLAIVGSGTFTYKDGNDNTTQNCTSYHHQGGWGNVFPEGAAITMSFINKYEPTHFLLFYGNCNLKDFVSTNLTRLTVDYCNLEEDINVTDILKNIPNLNRFTVVGSDKIHGLVEDFAPYIDITELSLGTDNDVYGDLCVLARRQIAAGRESASIASSWNGHFKFNDEQMPNTLSNTLSWEKVGNNYEVTMNAGPDFVRTVTVDSNGNIVQ